MSAKRGQVSMELVFAIVFILFIFMIVVLFAYQRTDESNNLKVRTDTQVICKSVAANINNIAGQGSGFYRYFSIPRRVYGGNEYNISVYGSWVEISLDPTQYNYTWMTQIITSNVTVFCLDKGMHRKNKVFSDQEKISIICHKPELIILNDSFRPISTPANESINVSIEIMNFGPVACGQFDVSFNNTNIVTVSSIASEMVTEVRFNMVAPQTRGYYPMEIRVDITNSVNESIESNNFYNATLVVV